MRLEIIHPSKKSKYRNVKCCVGDKKFDSLKEGKRYIDLSYLQTSGKISLLKTQVSFKIVINGHKICTYKADFTYYDATGSFVVEDVKGIRTPVYILKKKLLFSTLGISIQEI